MLYSNQLSNVEPALPYAACLIAQWRPTLCDPWTVTYQAPLSVEILQEGILEWVAMPSSRGSSWPSDRTQVSRIAGGFFTAWTTREAQPCLLVTVSCCSAAKSSPTPCDPVNWNTLGCPALHCLLEFAHSSLLSRWYHPAIPSRHPLLSLLLVVVTWSFSRPPCLVTHRRRKCNPSSLVGTLILDCWPPERCGNKFLSFVLLSQATSLGQPEEMIQTPSK